jgi:hypothetical protein
MDTDIDIATDIDKDMLQVTEYFIHQLPEADWLKST